MADYDSSLPVRTETKGDVVSKLVDTAGVNEAAINASGELSVTSTDLDIRDLAQATDSVTVGDGTSAVTVNADNGLEVHLNNTLDVTATDLDIRDLTSASDSVTVANTVGAPIYVNVVDGVGGTNTVDYQTTASVAKNASTTHTFGVSGGTFRGGHLHISGSGKLKVEVKSGVAASETTKGVYFNSTADPNIKVPWPVEVVDTHNILLVITNKDGQPQDVYTTIIGDIQ